MTQPRITLITRCGLAAIVMAGSVLLPIAGAQTLTENNSIAPSQIMPGGGTAGLAASVTITPGGGGDDTGRIQRAIDNSTGAIHFAAGVYNLYGPLVLRGGLRRSRTYTGEGSWDPQYGSTLLQHTAGAPIFSVEGAVSEVTISGLTFDGVPGVNAKGISAGNSSALLVAWTIRDSYFLTELAECIDAPMVLTRIERNQFGWHGGTVAQNHRHIHSVSPPNLGINTNANWVVGNQFRQATGSESVLFEQGVQLHIIGNDFEGNAADTTIRINGMFQVIIEGNWFEANAGEAQMTFATSTQPTPLPNYMVRLENNYYNMGGLHTPNKFVFLASGAVPQVYMGYETGSFFSPTAELTSLDSFQACRLKITGPLHLNGYMGTQAGRNPACD